MELWPSDHPSLTYKWNELTLLISFITGFITHLPRSALHDPTSSCKVMPQFVNAKLVNISPISLGFMANIYLYLLWFINQRITRGHCLVGNSSIILKLSSATVDGRKPAPVDRWFIHVYPTIYRVSTILLVLQDFAITVCLIAVAYSIFKCGVTYVWILATYELGGNTRSHQHGA